MEDGILTGIFTDYFMQKIECRKNYLFDFNLDNSVNYCTK